MMKLMIYRGFRITKHDETRFCATDSRDKPWPRIFVDRSVDVLKRRIDNALSVKNEVEKS